ncbi:MAG TPA: class I SAM-dependent methyltransferase [Vicinamibacterales bacterium]|jgi:SAM-dependent methyltransferase
MDLKEAGLLGPDGHRHWYYASKSRALLRCLAGRQPARILDVGAGSGLFSKMLLHRTTAKSAICVDSAYSEDWSETASGKPIAFRRSSPVGDADVVLLMDVLEHVDDDVGLLKAYAATARPGTRFVVSVPAFRWLWSRHDEFLEHRRRYTLRQLQRVLSDAGLSPIAGFYFFGALLPAVAISRLSQRLFGAGQKPKSDLRRHHPVTNGILTAVCLAECAIARHNRAFGLTAFGVAEKI